MIIGSVNKIYNTPQGKLESPIYFSLSSKFFQSYMKKYENNPNIKKIRSKASNCLFLYPDLTDEYIP